LVQTIVVPGGNTIVLRAGGGGLLLLKLRQPPRPSGNSKTNTETRIESVSPALSRRRMEDSIRRS
jgi:hypothetical protein